MITAQQIKELREKTGVSVSSCKKALEEASGNMEKALTVLQRESAKSAEKKQTEFWVREWLKPMRTTTKKLESL